MAKAVKKIVVQQTSLKVNGSLWLETAGQRFFGPGPLELLLLISETGSLNKAAKEMGLSYKKAWEIISRLNARTKLPVVVMQVGGEKGGGSILTEEATQLIKQYVAMRKRFDNFLIAETKKIMLNR